MTEILPAHQDIERINVDFDKTLTDPGSDEWSRAYEQEPNPEMVQYVQNLYFSGVTVIIWTARQWFEASEVSGWLTAHEVPHHGLMCGKGGSDAYIDDKALRPEEVLNA